MGKKNNERLLYVWWEDVEDHLLKLAMRFTGDANSASDLVQQVALAVLIYHKPFHNEEHFRRWLFQKVRWLGLDWLRKRKKENILFVDEEKINYELGKPDQKIDPDILELHREIEKLPDRQREAATRYYIHEQSTYTIAHDLNIHETTVRSLLRHARATLAERFAAEKEQ